MFKRWQVGSVALAIFFGLSRAARASIFGEETAVLLQVVNNQLTELNRLAEQIGISREQRDLLIQLNSGVMQTTEQIEAIQSIIQRAQGFDPSAIRDLASLNEAVSDMRQLSSDIAEVVSLKISLCDQAIDSSSAQSDTAYRMGQEMVGTGAALAEESKTASPGRANQITAAAASSQMLATGVELQTLSHIEELQAMSLDLQKTQMERGVREERSRREFFRSALKPGHRPSDRSRAGVGADEGGDS